MDAMSDTVLWLDACRTARLELHMSTDGTSTYWCLWNLDGSNLPKLREYAARRERSKHQVGAVIPGLDEVMRLPFHCTLDACAYNGTAWASAAFSLTKKVLNSALCIFSKTLFPIARGNGG